MSIEDDKTTYLVGDFSGAHVFSGGMFSRKIDENDLTKPFHDVTHRGHTYRFVNSSELSEKSIETLTKKPNTFVFGGDMHDILLNVNKDSVSAVHVPELDI